MGNIEEKAADVINGIGGASEILSDLISSKKQYIAKQLINVLLLLIILIVFGCFDFLHLEFHAEYLIDPNYWVGIGTKAVADICSYNVGVNFIIDDVIQRNKTLMALKRAYDNLNSCKQSDFDSFIDSYNIKQKTLAYKNKITHQIYMLNKRSRKKDIIYYNKNKDNPSAKQNRYFRKRSQLEFMKRDEYINENIDSLNVYYKNVDSSIFEIEINGNQKIVKNKVTGSVSAGRAIASASTLATVIIGSMVIQAISFAPNAEEFEDNVVAAAHYAMKIASDIAIILWQFMRGLLGTHNIVSQQITHPLAERVKILKEYYSTRLSEGKPVPQCYLNLLKEKKENQEEYVEMSEEEYKEFMEKKKEE